MQEAGVDVTSWDPDIYEGLKEDLAKRGTSLVRLREPREDGVQVGLQRTGAYVKILGSGTHVLYPEGFEDHKDCTCPSIFIASTENHRTLHDHAIQFANDHFGITAHPGLVYNWPPGIWPDIEIQEEWKAEYPIPLIYSAWPVTLELTPGNFDPENPLVSRVDGSKWVWVKCPVN